MDRERITALRRATQLGRTLQEDLGDKLRDFYQRGGTCRRAIDEFNVQEKYGVTYEVARVGIQLALAGSTWDTQKLEPYEGLIKDETDRKRIGLEHLTASGKSIGERMYAEGKGIHTQSRAQKRELGFKWGKTGGDKAYKEKKGYHARSQKKMKEDALKAVEARGQVPWSEEERKFACDLYRDGHKRLKITQAINGYFYKGNEIRTVSSVEYVIYSSKKLMKGKAQTS